MSVEELSEEDQMEFSVLYASLFSLSLLTEYLDALQAVISTRGSKYMINKCRDAAKVNGLLTDILQREFTKTMSAENKAITLKAIEDQKEFVFDIFLMDPTDQARIKGLIYKLKKEKA